MRESNPRPVESIAKLTKDAQGVCVGVAQRHVTYFHADFPLLRWVHDHRLQLQGLLRLVRHPSPALDWLRRYGERKTRSLVVIGGCNRIVQGKASCGSASRRPGTTAVGVLAEETHLGGGVRSVTVAHLGVVVVVVPDEVGLSTYLILGWPARGKSRFQVFHTFSGENRSKSKQDSEPLEAVGGLKVKGRSTTSRQRERERETSVRTCSCRWLSLTRRPRSRSSSGTR